MYKRKNPPKGIKLMTNEEKRPNIYLEDEYGGKSIIYEDGGCFILANMISEDENTIYFRKVYHWYPEAVKALQEYFVDVWREHRHEDIVKRWESKNV